MIYELAICVKDENDLPSGHKRIKEGDITSIRARQRKSTTEIDHWEKQTINGKEKNIPIMKDIDDDIHHGKIPLYNRLIIIADISDTEKNLRNKLMCNSDVKDKRRCSVSLNDIKSLYCNELDIDKVRDIKKIYQPFKKASKLIEKFDGKNGNHLIELKDVDCGINAEQEIIISLDASFVYNKDSLAYIAPKDLTIKETP